MAPKFKVTRDQVIAVALKITRETGIDRVTARELGAKLGVSSRPIFTWFESMEQVKDAVYEKAKALYRDYLNFGLKQPIPFLGVGQQFIKFAKDEGELFKLLFLTQPKYSHGGAMAAMKISQDLVRNSLMKIYRMDEKMADNYFRDLFLVAFSLGTLIVTNGCLYSDKEMSSIMSEFSLSICKAYKEIPGLSEGKYDKDALFRKLTQG